MYYQWIAESTFGEFVSEKIKSICSILNLETKTVLEIFDLMAESWKDLNISTESRWLSDITDDFTPFEFSLSLNHKQPVLRFLTDNLSKPYTLESSWDMGCKLNGELEKKFGASIARFQQIKHLFEPHDPQALFAIWHAVDLEIGRQPKFKLYLNPQCCGVKQAPEIVKEAFQRLGFTQAWNCISQFALQNAEEDEIKYFSLDLSSGADARVKVYITHKNATAEKLESVFVANPYHEDGEIREFCRNTVEQEGPFTTRPVISCFAFTTDNEMYPSSSTIHLPIRFYLNNDEIAKQNINRILSPENAAIYEQILSCIAERPLTAGTGIQTYFAFKRKKSKKSITAYIAPETYKLISCEKLMNKHRSEHQSQIAVSIANSRY